MQLPNEPVMLLSVINTMLRDKYSSFDDLCEDIDISADEIINELEAIGYSYNSKLNKFC